MKKRLVSGVLVASLVSSMTPLRVRADTPLCTPDQLEDHLEGKLIQTEAEAIRIARAALVERDAAIRLITQREWVNRIQSLRGGSRSAGDEAVSALINRINQALTFNHKGSLGALKDQLTPLFLRMETATSLIEKLVPAIEVLEGQASGAESSAATRVEIQHLRKQLDQQYRIFGRHFDAYMKSRAYLEAVAASPDSPQAAGVKNLLDGLGANARSARGSPVLLGQSRVTMERMKEIFDRSALARSEREKHYLRIEVWAALKTFALQPGFIQLAQNAATRVPVLRDAKFIEIVRLLQDSYYRQQFTELDEIVRMGDRPPEQFAAVRALAAQDSASLMTLARSVEHRPLWLRIKEYIASHPEEAETGFAKKVSQAEEEAGRRGEFSANRPPRPVQFIVEAIITGVLIYLLLNEEEGGPLGRIADTILDRAGELVSAPAPKPSSE